MKSLLKLTLICVLAFFSTGTIYAQSCDADVHMLSAVKILDTPTKIGYRISVFAENENGTAPNTIWVGNKVCRNTRNCSGNVYYIKDCVQKTATALCTVKAKVSCTSSQYEREGCIVVITPKPMADCNGYGGYGY